MGVSPGSMLVFMAYSDYLKSGEELGRDLPDNLTQTNDADWLSQDTTPTKILSHGRP